MCCTLHHHAVCHSIPSSTLQSNSQAWQFITFTTIDQSQYFYFTTKDTNKEKSIDVVDSKGRPIPKYQMYVFLLTINEQNLTRFHIPKYQTHVFLRTPMSKLWEGFPIAKYQMPMIVEREGFVISLHIDMEPRAGLTSWSFCVVPLKLINVMRSLVDSYLHVATTWTCWQLLSCS